MMYNLFTETPPVLKWKKLVKSKINKYWINVVENDAKSKSSLNYLKARLHGGQIHNVWKSASFDNISVRKACVKATILTGSYIPCKKIGQYFIN